MFAFLFGKREKRIAGAVADTTALDALHCREADLEKKIRQLESQAAAMHAQALEHRHGGRTHTALHLLKREKMTQDELGTVRALYTTVLQQQSALQQAILNAETFAAVHTAAEVLRKKQDTWTAEHVSDLMDTLEDAKEHSREIHDLLQTATRMDVSDAELLAQLDAETAVLPELPEVPREAPRALEELSTSRESNGPLLV
jgi:hypothetical protein